MTRFKLVIHDMNWFMSMYPHQICRHNLFKSRKQGFEQIISCWPTPIIHNILIKARSWCRFFILFSASCCFLCFLYNLCRSKKTNLCIRLLTFSRTNTNKKRCQKIKKLVFMQEINQIHTNFKITHFCTVTLVTLLASNYTNTHN